jgi:type I restriction enzyme M protein
VLYIERAIKDGYAAITADERGRKITYKVSGNHTERYDDPEEQVRAEVWAELIYNYSYPANRVKVEVTIPDRLPIDRADIVVFVDDECKRPYAVVECKKDGVTDAEFNQAIEQGVGNAAWVKLRAEYVLIVAGTTRRVLDVSDKYGAMERENNILADLPKVYGKPQEFRFHKGDKDNDIMPVSRETLITTIQKCHNTLWGGGRLSPPTAFGELCKLIFVKISDEQKARKKGEPYQFQIKTHEPSPALAGRINDLYDEQKSRDPEVFSESIKVDARVLRTVVSHLQGVNLSKTDLDVKGVAFELFMDSFFKGDFGQYFTPRPIIEFAIAMLKPEQESYVLDTSCGSGGFLLYAMDYIRKLAGEYYGADSADYYKYWHDFASKRLFGIEINDEIARVAKMNMIVHDDGHTNVINFDALDSIDAMRFHNAGFMAGKFDFIITNPPFGSKINASERPYLGGYYLGNTYDKNNKAKVRNSQSSEVLFVERIHEFLKHATGKAAIVLPDGVLTNSSMQYVRNFILEKFQLLAVVSLPQAAFAHFGAGVKASVIFVRKRGENEIPSDDEPIFMAAPEEIGYDATGRKANNQLPDVVKQYEAFCADPQSFFVCPPLTATFACLPSSGGVFEKEATLPIIIRQYARKLVKLIRRHSLLQDWGLC